MRFSRRSERRGLWSCRRGPTTTTRCSTRCVSRANADLGVTADLFWRRPGAKRGDHPFAFAALGPMAEAITADPLPLPPHRLESAVGRVFELGGQILLLGVGHDSNTTIHLAEALSGVPYGVPKHITVLQDGRPLRIDYLENDHCCQRFALADQWLRERGLQREGTVGNTERGSSGRATLSRLSANVCALIHWCSCIREEVAARSAITLTRVF